MTKSEQILMLTREHIKGEMETRETTYCKVIESALSEKAQLRPYYEKYQLLPWTSPFETQDHTTS